MNMPGQGLLMTRNPFSPGGRGLPFSSTTSASTPGRGNVAEPAFNGTRPKGGLGEIMIPPVSVCHQVSTIGHRPCPITSKYHCQAAGLIGSPTVPSRRKLARSCCLGKLSPWRISERLQLQDLSPAITTIRSHNVLCLAILYTFPECLRAEPREHYGERQSKSCASEHRDRELGDQGHVNRHSVTLPETKALKHTC